MEELIAYLSDPATLVTFAVVFAAVLFYFLTRGTKISRPHSQQSYDLGDGVRGCLSVKDGEMMKYLYDDVKTLYAAFQRGKRLSSSGRCLGYRILGVGAYHWLSYSEVEERSVTFGAGLCKLGIKPGQSTFLGIYGPNCVEWIVCEQSCNAYSRVAVPLYDTLGKEAVCHIINQAEVTCVVCSNNKVQNLAKLKNSCPQLKTIVVFGDSISEEDKKSAEKADIAIYTMKQVEEQGTNNPVDKMPAQPSDLATICYTSGTTGLPKGVMLTNENMIANASAMLAYVNDTVVIGPNDCHISYMPLAHMMERTANLLLFMTGASIGFFSGDVKGLVNDIQELKPTIFISVPRLLNRLYDKTINVIKSSKTKSWLYEMGFKAKITEVKRGIVRRNSLWDLIVFRKIQQSLGGRVKLIISGSAPIENSVMDFLRVAFGCLVCEGYGQTEATTALTFTHPHDTTTGHVGAVLPCARIRLRDVPGMNYYARNGEGEVCFTGPSTTQGYFKNPEKTAELFDEDGWARSGDIGKWLPNGTLKIIDRVKNIFKLSQGEYIAPEKVENVCTRSTFIAQMFLFGDSLKSCCVAIVVPDEEVLMKWAVSYGRKGVPYDKLCQDEAVHYVVFEDLKSVAKNNGLNSMETPKAIYLSPEMFSVDNDLLTPTFKLKRATAKAWFQAQIDQLYSSISQ